MESSNNIDIVFIGGGIMASCIVNAVVASGYTSKDNIGINVRTQKSCDAWKQKGFTNTFISKDDLFKKVQPKYVFLCIKPQLYEEVCTELGNSLGKHNGPIKFISIMAGITMEQLRRSFNNTVPDYSITRAMPNLPCQIQRGTTLLCSTLKSDELSVIKEIIECTGTVVEIDEKYFNVGSVLSGSAPAFLFTIIDALADGGCKNGLSKGDSLKLVASAFNGAAEMILQLGEHPMALKDKVCSAGGTTIAGIAELEKHGFRNILIETVTASTQRAKELGAPK
uniref:Pyrroline-5-carboxylate reductase n=1 Tax=Rhabditophanes sp. KR3021 TaxID=114890 RepID=A0AC35TYP0_9BILA